MTTTPRAADLASSSRLLHLVHHRNRNQHGAACWYSRFNQLRRHLAHLSREEACYALTCVRGAHQFVSSQRARKALARRIDFMREILVPKCFKAFANLVADSQYAVLGLVLVGELSRIHCALEELSDEVPEKEVETSKVKASEMSAPLLNEFQDSQDTGEIVARQGLFATPKENENSWDDINISLTDEESLQIQTLSSTNSKKKGYSKSTFNGEVLPKKQKKPKKGDIFDELFKGLK